MADARSAILGRIREQLGRPGSLDKAATLRAYEPLPRRYTRSGALAPGARLELLLARLADYDAEVLPVTEATMPSTIAAALQRSGESVLLAPAGVPDSWLPPGIEILHDSSSSGSALSQATLTRAPAVLTLCAGAIAETGTILLAHAPGVENGQGRRALTLLPDHHLCILRTDQIVETVSEGLALLESVKGQAITTISGPSATADIEMTRIRGVHGPRRLTVLLLR